MRQVIRKLKGRSLTELRVRGRQALIAQLERRGLTVDSRPPSESALFRNLRSDCFDSAPSTAESLLAHFRTRQAPAFFAAFADRQETIVTLNCAFDDGHRQATLEAAERIVRGEFDLLGLRGLRFGDPIDWHLEPLSGKRTPRLHWSRINYLDADTAGDKKILWELNRHQVFATLGRAYWRTGDERFAQTFAAHIAAWMEQNPPKIGIHWASSLEVAFRAIAWLWALAFFRDSPALTPPLFARILTFLRLHGRHVETYLSTYFSPNTHLTGEALSLYYLGMLLPELRDAARWRETGRRILLAQLDKHIRPDGVYFEQSSYYHRYTADFYTHFLLLARANGDPLPEKVGAKLIALLDHLRDITRPDGTTPLFGDDDGGKLMPLEERAPDDFRATLATGAALFASPDYKFVAGALSEETVWLLGSAGARAYDALEAVSPRHTSRAYPDGGCYILRDGWSPDANFLLLDCGPHGASNYVHAHADALAFTLAAQGRTLLADPGTYTYTGSAALRDHFRHAAAHNTLTVDGESSSVPKGTFGWNHIARAEAREWISQERFDYFEGEHDGYRRLESPVTHRRSVLFLKKRYWILRDRVETTGTHNYDLHFHFVPEASPFRQTESGVTLVRESNTDIPGLTLGVFGMEGAWRQEEGWISNCYAARKAAPVCVFTATGEGVQEFVTFLIPQVAGERAPQIRELGASGGKAFAIQTETGQHLLAMGAGALTAERLESDFAWAWLDFGPDNRSVQEIVLIGGQRLHLDGQMVFEASERVGFVSARRAGSEWMVETDRPEREMAFHPGKEILCVESVG